MNIHRPDGPYYDVASVCSNGHTVNPASVESPEFNTPFCGECGAKAINACPSCNGEIPGRLQNSRVTGLPWWPTAYCEACGKPYPWTEQRVAALTDAIELTEGLSSEDKVKLTQSIPDLIAETPKTDTAAARLKAAIKKAGKSDGKLLYDVGVKVTADVGSQTLKGEGLV